MGSEDELDYDAVINAAHRLLVEAEIGLGPRRIDALLVLSQEAFTVCDAPTMLWGVRVAVWPAKSEAAFPVTLLGLRGELTRRWAPEGVMSRVELRELELQVAAADERAALEHDRLDLAEADAALAREKLAQARAKARRYLISDPDASGDEGAPG